MNMNKRFFAEIAKTEEQSDGTIKVFGYASSPSRDSDGEIVTAEAMRAALPDYMKFGAVREMHGSNAAGTAIDAKILDDGRTWFAAHVVDPVAVKKVQTKTYKGFSIGGKVLERDENDPDTITSIRLVEVSLVDRPANPEAILTMFKAEDAAPDAAQAETGDAISQLVDLVKSAEIPADEMVRVLTDAIAKAKAKDTDADGEDGTDDEDTPEKADCAKETEGDEDPHNEAEREGGAADKAATAEEIAQGLEVIARAAAAQGLAKGLRGINALSAAIYQLVAVQAGVKREAEDEGDNSPVPGKIADAISSLLETLVEMAQEETSELAADLDEAGMQAAVPDYGAYSLMCADKVLTLAKARKAAPAEEGRPSEFGKAHLSEALLKVGKLESENAQLSKRVKELEAIPAPPKGALMSLDKGQDVTSITAQADEPPPNLSADERTAWEIKKAHRSGGTPVRFR